MKCESDLKTIINEAIRDGVKGAVCLSTLMISSTLMMALDTSMEIFFTADCGRTSEYSRS